VSRRDFFHRYDLVEREAAAVERAAAGGQNGALPPDSGAWPEEIREVLGKLESFVSMTFRQPHPVAQGVVELGDLVVLFRVVPKSPAEGAAPAAPAVPAAPTPPEGGSPARKRGAAKTKR